ncbi:MAG TPA: hypothetical protein VF590_24620 [Isosphaeraceae bacterium]|jgi:molybdopterin converting factor small subunit
MITVELYGVPRLRAGVARVPLEAATLGEALRGLGRACPALEGSVLRDGGLHPAYRLSINGDHFVADPGQPLADGDALLLLAADAGG